MQQFVQALTQAVGIRLLSIVRGAQRRLEDSLQNIGQDERRRPSSESRIGLRERHLPR